MPVVIASKDAAGPSAPISGAAPISATKRKISIEQQIVVVWSPDGERCEVTRQNAADLVRHCGWSRRPKDSVISAVEDDGDGVVSTGEDTGGKNAGADSDGDDTTDELTNLDVAMGELNALRDEAAALGVAVDARWGKRRLKTEIDNAKPAKK